MYLSARARQERRLHWHFGRLVQRRRVDSWVQASAFIRRQGGNTASRPPRRKKSRLWRYLRHRTQPCTAPSLRDLTHTRTHSHEKSCLKRHDFPAQPSRADASTWWLSSQPVGKRSRKLWPYMKPRWSKASCLRLLRRTHLRHVQRCRAASTRWVCALRYDDIAPS